MRTSVHMVRWAGWLIAALYLVLAIAYGVMNSPSVSVIPFTANSVVSPPSYDTRMVGKP